HRSFSSSTFDAISFPSALAYSRPKGRRTAGGSMPGSLIFALALAYLLLLFAVASYGDRKAKRTGRTSKGRPLVYALSLAIYCTSWTYFGGVGLATTNGLEFAGIYIGPILMFTLGMPLLRRIVTLAKSERLTSIADFVAARY